MTIVLDADDRALLRACPQTFREDRSRKPSKAHSARAARIKRLWKDKLLKTEVISNTEWRIKLTNAGRAAMGWDPLPEELPPC